MVKGFNKFSIELTTKATYNCEMHVAFFIYICTLLGTRNIRN